MFQSTKKVVFQFEQKLSNVNEREHCHEVKITYMQFLITLLIFSDKNGETSTLALNT